MLWRWFQDWRDRRSALTTVKESQRSEEVFLAGQLQNPFHLAQLSLQRDDIATATYHWDRARLMMPSVVVSSNESVDILIRLKRHDEAEALMRERNKRLRGDRFWLIGLARVAEDRGDMTKALEAWKTARKRTGNQPDAYLGCARCLVALGRLDEAEAEYEAALRRTTQEIFPLLGLARISDLRKDWPRSAERYQKVAEMFNYGPAFGGVAKALIQLDRLGEAEAYLREPASALPSDLDIGLTRAALAERRGDVDAACERWTMVRRAHPFWHDAYREPVRLLSAAGRHAEADAVLLDAISRFPDITWPMHDYARIAHERRDWTAAAERWAALRQRFPDEGDGWSRGAEALRAAGRDDEAAALRPDA